MNYKYLFTLLAILYSYKATCQQNDLRIIYDANQGVSELAGANKVYMYSGAVTSGSSGQWEYIIGSTNQDDGIGQMTPLGNNKWSICINPSDYYNSGLAGPIPNGSPILAIDLFFRNADGTAFGYDFNGNNSIIDMTGPTPTSNFPGITIETCTVRKKELPAKATTMGNFPNPLVDRTVITYYLQENAGIVKINIYDMLGQQVKQFVSEMATPGIHKVNWRGDDRKGAMLQNGIYFYSLEIDGVVIKTNKLLISR